MPHSEATCDIRVQYGGSFDPVHNGHLAVACAVRDALAADVHLMPASDPPHKPPTHADAQQRAQMLALAVADVPGLHVDTRELQRDGPSWTIDTLHQMREQFGPRRPLALVIGADSFLGLPSWKRWRELLPLAHLIIAERPGQPLDGPLPPELAGMAAGRWLPDPAGLRASPAGRLWRLRLPLRPESSSRLRQRIAAADPGWSDWLPPAVAGYIRQHGLYHGPAL